MNFKNKMNQFKHFFHGEEYPFNAHEFARFIKSLIIIAIPIILQNLFLNLASLLDTLMVGQLDNSSISGVYIATQIIFVVNLIIYGGTEGGSIFLCQFFGKNDHKKMVKCFVFKIYFSILFALIAIVIVLTCAEPLSRLFSTDEEAIQISITYLRLLSLTFIPYAITSSLATSIKEIHHTLTPMIITLIGVCLNCLFNYILIFGKLGITPMNATGAAIGTIIERYVECIILLLVSIIKKYPFIKTLKADFRLNKELLDKLIIKSIPLVLNEFLWSLSQTMLVYFFTQCDEIATSSLPIASTILNLLFVVCMGLGNSVTILLGNAIGAGERREAQRKAYYAIINSIFVGLILFLVLFIISPYIVKLYTGVSLDAQEMASYMIKIYAVYIFICSINNTLFFTIRSGGRTLMVFLFDSAFGWIIQIPIAFIILKATSLPLKIYFPVVYSIEVIKIIIGLTIVISKKWIKNLTVNTDSLKETN